MMQALKRIATPGLILILAALTVALGLGDLSKPWSIAAQLGSAIVGAALGASLQIDSSEAKVRDVARPAVRHLFDQLKRLRGLVLQAEARQAYLEEISASGTDLDPGRTADWFGGIGNNLRDEIDATATAIETWADLAPDIRQNELANYENRPQQLPTAAQNGA